MNSPFFEQIANSRHISPSADDHDLRPDFRQGRPHEPPIVSSSGVLISRSHSDAERGDALVWNFDPIYATGGDKQTSTFQPLPSELLKQQVFAIDRDVLNNSDARAMITTIVSDSPRPLFELQDRPRWPAGDLSASLQRRGSAGETETPNEP
jgi:hypothetical protein